jgi:hypothetical protein
MLQAAIPAKKEVWASPQIPHLSVATSDRCSAPQTPMNQQLALAVPLSRQPMGERLREGGRPACAEAPHYAGGRAIKSGSLGSASATVSGRPKLLANTSGGFEASHALRSWER